MKLGIILLVASLVLPFVLTDRAYADYNATYGTYFCNSSDLAVERSTYSYLIYQENRYWDSQTPNDIAVNVLRGDSSRMLDDLGKAYHCLKSNGVDPNSVAVIPSYLIEGMNLAKQQNPERFAEVVPNFSDYVPVPEFGQSVGIIAAISTIGTIIFSRKIR